LLRFPSAVKKKLYALTNPKVELFCPFVKRALAPPRYNTDSMTEQVSPARALHGVISPPGDKSISHRYALLASLAEGTSTILNFSTGADCHSTLACLAELGVDQTWTENEGRSALSINGKGLRSLREPARMLDAGNSGSTIRMLSGILAAQTFTTRISGDESLIRRPMRRIMQPLSAMGAHISATNEQFPPLTIQGSALLGIDYELPVASAQVKSCVLLAGLYAVGETTIREPITTRDHTEIALREMGADIDIHPRLIRIRSNAPLAPKNFFVPGDLSSAAFFLIAALALPDSDLIVSSVGLNPTRTALLDVLRSMGAQIKILHLEEANGELIGSLQVKSSRIRGGIIDGPTTAAVIDEIPALAVLGALSQEGLEIRDAGELRVKETDRIETIAQNLRRMGASVSANATGLSIPGGQKLHAAELDSCGDHRIAMAFSIAALAADGPCLIQNAAAASVSFPEFYTTLRQLTQ
jgi:3-phosphoshikimate 1-carboxyvinyltransferase